VAPRLAGGGFLIAATVGAFPATASALVPQLGRWSGNGPGGEIQFVVARVGGTLVLGDVVVSCPGGAQYDDADEDAIESNGQLYGYDSSPNLTGKLGLASGRGQREPRDDAAERMPARRLSGSAGRPRWRP
jgi:hypothetical protein